MLVVLLSTDGELALHYNKWTLLRDTQSITVYLPARETVFMGITFDLCCRVSLDAL